MALVNSIELIDGRKIPVDVSLVIKQRLNELGLDQEIWPPPLK